MIASVRAGIVAALVALLSLSLTVAASAQKAFQRDDLVDAAIKLEAQIKAETQATIRNIPFTSKPPTGKKCLKCDAPATVHAWFAKSY